MQQEQPINCHRSVEGEYEISILDILVVLAENVRAIIFIPLVVGLITLGVSFLIPPTYQSVSLLSLGENAVTGMKTQEVMKKVLQQTDWIKASTHQKALEKMGKKINIIFDRSGIVKITTEGPTAQQAEMLNSQLIEIYKNYSRPKGNTLELIKQNILIGNENLIKLEEASKKIGGNLVTVNPGTEGDNVARAYVTISSGIISQKINLLTLRQSLEGFGFEVMVQSPTLQEDPIKPNKAKITLFATLASGFLTIIFVLIRAAFRNLNGDNETSEKIRRIRNAI